MTTDVLANGHSVTGSNKILTVALWTAQLLVAAILGMAAFTKLFVYTPEGSMALAAALGVGRGVVTLIGLVELSAAALILIPRRHTIGAGLAAVAMGGALFSHATKIGWSGNATAEMWPLALLVLAAALFVVFGRRA
jgi:uncharacterized membrane protein YphA (DoxX/SURF4 family)